MSAVVISTWCASQQELQEVREIFFESSTRKEFKDQAERAAFEYKYLGYYLKHHPELVLLALKEGKVLGYLVGSPDTSDPELMKLQPHLRAFQQHFTQFPAHLHINLHHEARGQGVGQLLMKEFESRLQSRGIEGVHLMTGVAARNRSFYQRLGYSTEIIETFQGQPILFMGKRVSEN